jgi:glycosyltransferase involved in cell wall biosynthesis
MPIRVLFMQSQAFFGADSGVHARYMRHFDRRDVEVHVACTTVRHRIPELSAIDQIRQIPDVHIRETDFGPSVFDTSVSRKLALAAKHWTAALDLVALGAYIRRHKIQIIHCTEKPRDAFYGVALGRLTGAKSVVQLHVGYADWMRPTARWGIRHADAVVGVSDFVARTAVDAGIPPQRVYSVVNWLDELDRWNPGEDPEPVRRSLGIPRGAPVLGIVARLFEAKGHTDLVRATAVVKQSFPDVRVLVVGEDDPRAHPGGGSYRAELEVLVRQLGVEENVIFTGFRTDVSQLMNAMDVYTMPSLYEPLGMVYLEAMALQKPVVALRSGGVPEVVVDGETGFLTEPGDVPGLSEAILKLLRDPQLRRRFGEAGRRRVEVDLAPQRMCQQMVDVYRQTLSGARRRTGNPGSTAVLRGAPAGDVPAIPRA